MFSNLSASSISFATVTPSLVIRGAPNDLSRTTLRPLGPTPTLTPFATTSTPPPVAPLDIHRLELSILATRAGTSSNHLSLHRLLFRRVGDDDAARGFLLGLDAPNQHAIVQRTEFHENLLELNHKSELALSP